VNILYYHPWSTDHMQKERRVIDLTPWRPMLPHGHSWASVPRCQKLQIMT